MKLIVGLGNPDKEYIGTRHNVGYDLIDIIINKYDNLNLKNKFNGLYQIVTIKNEKVIFLKPQTYMNLSGDSIQAFINFYKLNPSEDLIVIYDDMDINLGNYKIKQNGSSAGHNGIKSILNKVSNEFLRIKIGIGKNKNENQVSFVLGKFSKDEQEVIENVYKEILNIVNDSLDMDYVKLMNKYNKKNTKI